MNTHTCRYSISGSFFFSWMFVGSILGLAVCQNLNGDDGKLDDGLDNAEKTYPIFVRMQDQLFKKGGDYESFCQANSQKDRLELRTSVIASLREKSDKSWTKIKDHVEAISGRGSVSDIKRYWIVNGFACRASGAACKTLAEMDGVSFVYRQRLRGAPLHQRKTIKVPVARQTLMKRIHTDLIKRWHDDSEDPVTTDGVEIPWNVKRIKAPDAWTSEDATGKGIVIALCDSGLMVTPSLTAALWRNSREEINGEDDDENGYVDDLFGYDFRTDSSYALGDGAQITHGSMCGGIIAGRPLGKKKIITGIAPRSRLMVLRGMGQLISYEYALANGADIISMSYMWVGIELGNYRGLYRLAHEHLAAGGIVSVGGAGNFGPGAGRAGQPKGKQIALPKDIPCVIAAAGILKNGTKAPAGSEGPCTWSNVKFYEDYPEENPLQKPDVTGCFGGYPVWGRPSVAKQVGRWKLVSDEGSNIGLVTGPQGNSFSGPHAAGVAALMLSVNPELNTWEVKKLMEDSCDDIGKQGHDPQFGAGLLNALSAVRAAKKHK